jgi:LPXTG-motif cell wall-anchored protein
MEFHGVEPVRFIAIVYNISLIAVAVGLRAAMRFRVNVNKPREIVIELTWLILLGFFASLVAGLFLFRRKKLCIATALTAALGAAIYYAWFDTFLLY